MSRSTRARRSGIVVAGILAAIAIGGATAIAGHRFVDVPDGHLFHDDIAWMADNEITFGCNPPANNEYCPEDFTTRGQMAAFFKRFAESQAIDAGTLDGKDSTAFLPVNGKAADSDKLDGKDSTAFLAANGKAADSDLLDGKDSTAFLAANGKAADSDLLDGKDSTAFLGATVTPRTTDLVLQATVEGSATATCQAGEAVIGGGVDAGDIALGLADQIIYTQSIPEGNGWTIEATSSVAGTITVYALCASIP